MIDINKQFEKLSISCTMLQDGKMQFTFEDGTVKIIDQKQLEQYLFMCMLDFINE